MYLSVPNKLICQVLALDIMVPYRNGEKLLHNFCIVSFFLFFISYEVVYTCTVLPVVTDHVIKKRKVLLTYNSDPDC